MPSAAAILAAFTGAAAALAAQAHPGHGPAPAAASERLIAAVNAVPTAASLARWHELLGSEPHVAGTPGDARAIARIRDAFVAMGLTVAVEEFDALLPQPSEALVEIVGGPEMPPPGAGGRRGVIALPTVERNLAIDPSTAHPGLTFGWNAYSGSGDVSAGVVYANRGTKRDFELLREWGVDCRGKVVLARYGGNFRGFKAKFAVEAGAAALVIFTDPADAAPAKGKVWPEGGWANDTCVQRGSVYASDQPGDPQTPGYASAPGAPRRDLAAVPLPRIPVQPVGYAAAAEIIRRMQGAPVPADGGWKGGLPFEYRLDGGPELLVRVKVAQDREVRRSANVVAVLAGSERPEQLVIVGCHHDAWGFGAADPGAGTMCLLEAARCFADLARRSIRPARTIVFAAWGAEEFGIIGSTEWVEGHAGELLQGGVTYINLDMAAMGPNPSIALTPELAGMVSRAVDRVPSATDPGRSVLAALRGDAGEAPRFGALGGGSDHIGFVCRVGVPSVSLGAGGAPGTSYHSNYDTVSWYRATVGQDYASAAMITREAVAIAALAAQTPVPGWRVQDLGRGLVAHLDALLKRCENESMRRRLETLRPAMEAMVVRGELIDAAIAANPELNRQDDLRVRRGLRSMLQAYVDDAGLDGRPWFRSLIAASDRNDGYAPCMLPLLAEAVADRDMERLERAVERMAAAQDRAEQALRLIETGLQIPRR
jgi:N-acetylated-alpha-linked acidic dipeptidase